MTNKNHSYDGSELTGMISGFTEYSTKGLTSNASPRPVVTPVDLLTQIQELRKVLSQKTITDAIDMLNKHIASKNNPHDTELSDFSDRVIDILYNYYTTNGGTATKSQYATMLFKVLHMASTEDMENGTDSTALISVVSINQYIQKHEADIDAHKEILERLLPGKPVTTTPNISIMGKVGIAKSRAKLNGDVLYTYVTKGRRIATATVDEPLPQDFTYGEPLIPCFGVRTNEIPNSTDFSVCNYNNLHVGDTDIVDLMGSDSATSIISNVTTEEVLHEIRYPNVTILGNEDKTFSVYVKAGSCNYFMISYEDMVASSITVQAIYNLDVGEVFISNHLNRYTAEIVPLADGWYRCSFSMYHPYGQQADLVMTCFKTKDPKQQDYKYQSDTEEVAVYLWGMQYELGNNASPYIPTSGEVVTRQPVELIAEILPNDGIFENNITLHVTYRNSGVSLGNLIRPLLTTYTFYNYPNYTNNDVATELTLHHDNSVEALRWGTISVENISTRTVVYEDILPKQDGSYIHVTHSVDSEHTWLAYNKETFDMRGLSIYADPDCILRIGHDSYGRYAETYLRQCIVYLSSVSKEQCLFLNGEEGNE